MRRRIRMGRRNAWLVMSGTLAMVALFWVTAHAAGVVVPPSRLDEDRFVPDPNQMKPDVCGGIHLTNIVVASGGTAVGTAANDLVLGTASSDALSGRGGDDCILAGDAGLGNLLCGEDGNDVLVGRPGTLDLCLGGAGSDLMYDCDFSFQDPGPLDALCP